MQFRALIKQTEGWWIGWLLDLPGVNAQERTRERLIESDTIMTTIEIPMPPWAEKAGSGS
ncbi:MAG: type II toxin-antitoxin system HicB family antitoxin [Deltaproteobacteria bacterium]|jgi:predicted RNase H-like HicB family nuclease|nr:type II toxin-antitoxin system HicB family antitoxin [Deltaproteobacteria bacterium]